MTEPDPEPTPVDPAEPSIEQALARLEVLSELPVDQHPAVYDEIHAELRAALTSAGREPAADQ